MLDCYCNAVVQTIKGGEGEKFDQSSPQLILLLRLASLQDANQNWPFIRPGNALAAGSPSRAIRRKMDFRTETRCCCRMRAGLLRQQTIKMNLARSSTPQRGSRDQNGQSFHTGRNEPKPWPPRTALSFCQNVKWSKVV